MTIVSAVQLTPAELLHLGNNLAAEVRADRDELAAERSLTALGEPHVVWFDA